MHSQKEPENDLRGSGPWAVPGGQLASTLPAQFPGTTLLWARGERYLGLAL